jgi:hypothetical protein
MQHARFFFGIHQAYFHVIANQRRFAAFAENTPRGANYISAFGGDGVRPANAFYDDAVYFLVNH